MIKNTKQNQIVILAHSLVWILFVVLTYTNVMLPALRSEKPFGITHDKGVTTIIDFPSHFNFAKEFWLSKTASSSGYSIYSAKNHLEVTSKWANSKINHSLPFGYSPTMLWLLFPLALFSHAVAFSIFTLAGLWSIWWQTRPMRCRYGATLFSFYSSFAAACLLLGQTALLTGAGLLYIAESTSTQRDGNSLRKSTISTGIILWLLTAKPPLALTACAVLVALRKWQPVLVALILTIIMTLAISPLLGVNWLNDYWEMIKRYDLVHADQTYKWSLVPKQMSNLRSILNVDFKIVDNIASRISSVAWFSSLACMMTMAGRFKLQEYGCWALGIIFYLLFCPHVSFTEELQLLLLLPLCVPATKEILKSYELVLFCLVPFLPFCSPATGPFFLDVRWGMFVAKMALAVVVIYYYRGHDKEYAKAQ